MKKTILAITLALSVALASFGSTLAVTALYKQVTGIGNVDYSEEITFSDLVVVSPTKVKVVLTSNANTVAGFSYVVTLYLDGVVSGAGSVSWTAGQIPGTSKTTQFTGLSLGSVTAIGAEVTK